MSSDTSPNVDGDDARYDACALLIVVSGSTFDGEPYQVVLETSEVARGASGKIFRGTILGTARIVAVKVIPGLLDPVLEALLARELRAAKAVSALHQYILPFLGTADVGGRTGIVSVFMDNGNLKQYIERHPDCDKKKLIVQVADAVSFLHGTKKLVHGDIKCENVLISSLGDALLADFGLSTFAEKSQAATATMTAIRGMNTLQFAAPELLLGEGESIPSKTCESDIYAFGMLVLEALSGDLPWPKDSNLSVMRKVCSGERPARPTLNGPFVTISHSWWEICRRCWRFNSNKRPQITGVLCRMMVTEPAPCWELPVENSVCVTAYMPDGRRIVAASNGALIFIDTTSGKTRYLGDSGAYVHRHGLAVSPDGRHVACAGGRTIWVVDATSGALVNTSQRDASSLTCVAYSRDGTRIASGADSGSVRLWNAATGTPFGRNLVGHSRTISDVSFSPDGICLASASEDGSICVWDCVTCTLILTLKLPDPLEVVSMEFSPDRLHVIAGYGDGKVIVWDVREGRARYTFQMGHRGIFGVAYSPSGKYVAAGSDNEGIIIWDAQDGTQIGPPVGTSDDGIASVSFSPDGKSLVSTGWAFKVRVWDLFD